MTMLNVSCPSCWGHGFKGQADPRKPNLPCTKCEAGRVAVEAGCDACNQTGQREALRAWRHQTQRFEPVMARCACVVRELVALGFYRGRKKRPA